MATTAGHRLTLDPMGKMFQNSSLKPLGQLKPNCPGMNWTCTNCFLCRSEIWPPRNDHWKVLYKVHLFFMPIENTAELSLTLDPMGKMFQNASSLKPLGQLKPNFPGMIIGRSCTKFLFFMPIGNPRWPPPQDID